MNLANVIMCTYIQVEHDKIVFNLCSLQKLHFQQVENFPRF